MRDGINEGLQLLVRRRQFRRALSHQPFKLAGAVQQHRLRQAQGFFGVFPVEDFLFQLGVRCGGDFGEFMLAQRTDHQSLIHGEGRLMEPRGFGDLNHDADRAFIHHDRPHRIRQEDGMRFEMFPFRVALGISGAKNALQHGHAFILGRQHSPE